MRSLLPLLILSLSFVTLAQPTVSFTFDDGTTGDRSGYSFEEWNQMILSHMSKAQITGILFSSGYNKSSPKGKHLLKSWDDAGHMIANHTFTHPNFNSKKINLAEFKQELVGMDTIISRYDNYTKLFRFPYLKEGNTPEEVRGIRSYLKELGYKNGYVTIDASDWYIDSRLRKRLKEDPNADLSGFRDFYLEHMYARAKFYEDLSYQINRRHIKHTLLLHHNLAAALFLGDLIEHFMDKGWNIISANEAFEDPVFNTIPKYAGESLIWALAKDAGKFEDLLRYPAEDSRYEEATMDELGL